MDKSNRFSLMIDALAELAEEEQVHHASRPSIPGLPSLRSVIADTSPLPHEAIILGLACLLYTSPSPRDRTRSRMPSSA